MSKLEELIKRFENPEAHVYVRAYQSKDPWEFVASSEMVDRYGDIIVAAGWNLKNFTKNPIALWQHQSSSPIGTWENVRVEGDKLIGRLNMVKPGVSSIADMLRGMVENRVIRAVSVGFRPMKPYDKTIEPILDDKGNPTGGLRFLKADLMEISLVTVPANPEALSLAKSLGATTDALRAVFAENGADTVTGMRRRQGLPAPVKPATTIPKDVKTMDLAARIAAREAEIAVERDAITTLTNLESLTDEQTVELETRTASIEKMNASLETLRRAQAAIAASAAPAGSDRRDETPPSGGTRAPSIITARGQKDAGILLVRAAMAHARAYAEKRTLEDVLRTQWGGDRELETIARAAVDPATIGTSAWAGTLVNNTIGGFVEILRPGSVFWNVAAVDYTFASGPIKLPNRTSGTLSGGFIGDGSPIPVKKVALGSVTITPYKLAVITAMTREIMRQSDPALEPILRQMMIDDTNETIDTLFLDATAISAGVRPAGLQDLAGANTAASGGTDLADVVTDLKNAVAAMGTNKMGKRPTWILDPQRLASLSLMMNAAGGFVFKDEIMRGTLLGYPFISSVNVPDSVVFLIDAAEIARAAERIPQIDISEQATLHMEDTSPTALSATGTPNTVAAPIRSLFQTASMALRLLWDVSWQQRRSNAVYTITSVTW